MKPHGYLPACDMGGQHSLAAVLLQGLLLAERALGLTGLNG